MRTDPQFLTAISSTIVTMSLHPSVCQFTSFLFLKYDNYCSSQLLVDDFKVCHLISDLWSLNITLKLLSWSFTIYNFCMYYCNCQIVFTLLQFTFFLCAIVINNFFCKCRKFYVAKTTSRSTVTLFITTYITHYSLYTICYWLTLWLVELLLQLNILNITTECSNSLSYNNGTNIITLTTA